MDLVDVHFCPDEHHRRDIFTYQAEVDGTATRVKIVFMNRKFHHVEYHGSHINREDYSTYYSRNGWRFLRMVEDRIRKLEDQMQMRMVEGYDL